MDQPPKILNSTPIVNISLKQYSLSQRRNTFIADRNSPNVKNNNGNAMSESSGFIIKFNNPIIIATGKNPQEGTIEKISSPKKICTKKSAKALIQIVSKIRFIIKIGLKGYELF